MPINLIDVSSHQGSIDWAKVKASGIHGAYIKATEGGSHIDPKFASNWYNSFKADLPRGAYHYAHPGSQYTAAEQARFILGRVGDASAEGVFPIALDIETRCWDGTGPRPPYAPRDCAHRTQSPAVVQEWVRDFISAVRVATSRDVIVYTGQSFLKDVLNGWGDYRHAHLWLADYEGALGVPAALIRQTTSSGTVPGIAGSVDMDVFLASRVTFSLFDGGGVAGAVKQVQYEASKVIANGFGDIQKFRGLYS